MNKFFRGLSNFPFNPQRFPIFYGWVILFWGTLGVILSIPGQTMGVGVFTEHLIEDLHISRNALSIAYGIGTLCSSFLLTTAGRYYDRYGARVIASVSAVCLGVVLLFLGNSEQNIRFLSKVINLKMQHLAFINMVVGFFLLRFFAQGVLTMASRNMVMKWFDKSRGFVNAIHGVFVAFVFSFAPNIFSRLINHTSWQQAWINTGIIIGTGFVVFIWVFYRDNPKDCGLKPDGEFSVMQRRKIKDTTSAYSYTLKEAFKTRQLWSYSFALGIHALVITALTFHIESVFGIYGYPKEVALSIFVPAAVISVITNVLASWLSDYIKLYYFLLVLLSGLLMVLISIVMLGESLHLARVLMVAGYGLSVGMFGVIISLAWPRFFGLDNLGEISGFGMTMMVAGSALGPSFFSFSLYFSTNYVISALFLIVIIAILFVSSLKIRNVNSSEV